MRDRTGDGSAAFWLFCVVWQECHKVWLYGNTLTRKGFRPRLAISAERVTRSAGLTFQRLSKGSGRVFVLAEKPASERSECRPGQDQ
jgi:hypothetical protein